MDPIVKKKQYDFLKIIMTHEIVLPTWSPQGGPPGKRENKENMSKSQFNKNINWKIIPLPLTGL